MKIWHSIRLVTKILVIFMLVVVCSKRIYVLTWSYPAIYRGCIGCIWVVSWFFYFFVFLPSSFKTFWKWSKNAYFVEIYIFDFWKISDFRSSSVTSEIPDPTFHKKLFHRNLSKYANDHEILLFFTNLWNIQKIFFGF